MSSAYDTSIELAEPLEPDAAPDAEDPTGIDGGWRDPDQETTSTHAEFDGDVGGLDPVARRALVLLMKNRFITRRSHRAEYDALVANTTLIRARLNDMYLSLELDPDLQVAYKQQVISETSGRYPTLLHATEWPREETILLVHARSLVRANRAAGHTRTVVDRADLMAHLAELTPATDTDRVGVTRRSNRAIEALVSSGVLVGRKDATAFEIDPAIEALLPLSTLESLLAWLRADGQPAHVPTEVRTDDDAPTERTTAPANTDHTFAEQH
ncbi:hypothetical protein CBR64_17795 [Cellulosimicrobium cellulans]|uniref:DUF4194 domain-containing protein n=1 Tax=Cellulosimicrobium cellulans TaxID=1710 RepID=A0A1Y0HYE3_CELCE|nr:DUF4194 domain-containing protein [Cellulosimicrobium cellulans]ARU53010.1 hypothetical protein CBR64_17795 [Cellulosimicrobium cellulans]